MKTLRIELNSSVVDALQFHNKSVQILSYVFKFHSIMEEEHVGDVVRFVFKAGEQPVEIIIDTADLLGRLFKIGQAACLFTSVHSLDQVEFGLPTNSLETLPMLASQKVLSSSELYWFEMDNALSFSTLESYLRTKHFRAINDTVRNCAVAISVINDCYQLLRYGPSFTEHHKLCFKTMVSGYQALKIWCDVGWRTTKENRSLTLLTTYQNELSSLYGQNFFVDITSSDDELCSRGYSQMSVWRVHLLREVFSLLWCMPPYLRDEAVVVVENSDEHF